MKCSIIDLILRDWSCSIWFHKNSLSILLLKFLDRKLLIWVFSRFDCCDNWAFLQRFSMLIQKVLDRNISRQSSFLAGNRFAWGWIRNKSMLWIWSRSEGKIARFIPWVIFSRPSSLRAQSFLRFSPHNMTHFQFTHTMFWLWMIINLSKFSV